jgi:CRP/FNR family cyclic AMP-dependent transcriptional regulator
MQTIEDLLGMVQVFNTLPAAHRATISGCGRTAVFEAGEYLMQENEPADVFYVLRSGAVAIQTAVPQGGAVTLETLREGDLLGWSWLFPPYRTSFDALALERTHALMFDGVCLRGKCDADPALGYDLFKLFAGVVIQRLQNTRLQLLDMYGPVAGS